MSTSPIRVLWIVNIVLPAVAKDVGVPQTPFGSWLSTMTQQLAGLADLRIGVAMRAPVPKLVRIERGGITYYAIPHGRLDKFDVSQQDCDWVLRDFAPDIVHSEGSEMAHSRRFFASWPGLRLLSLQGVINGFERYELGRLPLVSMLNPLRPRHCVTAIALIANKILRFNPRLAIERDTIRLANNIMGRTIWDQAQVAAINPTAQYFHCAHILRDAFRQQSWALEQCERGSIFVGNGASPRKGAHIALSALSILRRHCPDARLYIAGEDPNRLSRHSLKRNLGYSAYLLDLISRLGLQDHVTFTGVLDEAQMAQRMRASNVFLLPSIIENSPNTLAEAMMLGVPSVSAYVGGVASMARDEEEALFYRADDPAMLALQLKRLMNDTSLARRISEAAKHRARHSNDAGSSLHTQAAVYRQMAGSRGG